MAAFNDMGIVTLPSGKNLAISVFVSDFKAPKERGIDLNIAPVIICFFQNIFTGQKRE